MPVDITGWAQLQANLNALAKYFSTDAIEVSREEILSVAEDMAEAARQYAPELTGNLKSKIHVVDLGEQGVEVHSDAPYSMFVEFGTVKMEAQPFFRPAYEQYGVIARLAGRHRQEVEDILE